MRTGPPAVNFAKKFGSPSRTRSSSAVFGSGVEDEASCVASAAWSVASNASRAASVSNADRVNRREDCRNGISRSKGSRLMRFMREFPIPACWEFSCLSGTVLVSYRP